MLFRSAMSLAEMSYRLTQTFPREEAYGMTSQIRRAAASVPANIAEGYGREHRLEYIHFLQIAQGSLKEVETHLILSARVGLTSQAAIEPLLSQSETTGKILHGLIRALQKNRE